MVEPEQVPEEARQPPLERVEVGERVVADAEQDMHGHVDSREDVLERICERTSVAAVIQDVLLHLIEDHVELGARRDRALHERISERDVGWRPGRGRDSEEWIVAPAVDDHDLGPFALAAGRRHKGAQPSRHPGPQQRALADTARPVEHRQTGRH